jgi:hypothetical protein
VDVTIVDVPAFLAGIGRSAAGEFGHAPLKRGPDACANRPMACLGSGVREPYEDDRATRST